MSVIKSGCVMRVMWPCYVNDKERCAMRVIWLCCVSDKERFCYESDTAVLCQ